MAKIPENCVFNLDAVKLSVDWAEHPWCVAQQAAIDARWAREENERPWLFNGTVMMHRGLKLVDGRICGISHRVPYAALLHLERTLPDDDAWHLFGSAVILSSDNAMVLIRMASKTANPGKVCAPAGMLDQNDIVHDRVDVSESIRREAKEETGIDLVQAEVENSFLCWRIGCIVAVFQRFRLKDPASVLVERIRQHIRTDTEQEIEDVVVVSAPEDAGPNVPSYMQALIDFPFSAPDDTSR